MRESARSAKFLRWRLATARISHEGRCRLETTVISAATCREWSSWAGPVEISTHLPSAGAIPAIEAPRLTVTLKAARAKRICSSTTSLLSKLAVCYSASNLAS